MYLEPLPLANRLGMEWTLACTATVLVVLRIFVHVRGRKQRKTSSVALTISDSFLVLTLLMAYYIFATMAYRNSRFDKDPRLIFKTSAMKVGYSQGAVYEVCLWLVKGSFLAFFFSVQRFVTPAYKRLLWAACAYAVATFAVNFIIEFRWCYPISTVLDGTPYYCSPNIQLVPAAVLLATNTSTDVMIMVLGLLLVRSTQLGRYQRCALAFVLAVGLVPVVASALRFAAAFNVYRTGDLSLRNTGTVEIWTEIDGIFALHAACLPGLRAFVRERRARGPRAAKRASSAGSAESARPQMKAVGYDELDLPPMMQEGEV